MKTLLTIASIGWLLTLGSATALAGAPMGPAMGTIEKGQWSLGFEYAFENITLSSAGRAVERVGGSSDRYNQEFEIDDLETNMFFGRLSYGLCDKWDLFVRVGAADAQDDLDVDGMGVITGTGANSVGLDGSYGLAWGIGTRATFWTSGPWQIAGLAQATWLDPGDGSFRMTDPGYPNEVVRGDASVDYLQTQFALTAIYQEEDWGVWAGPFLQLIDGDLDLDARFVIDGTTQGTISYCGDVEEESQVGVHAGAACGLSPDVAGWVEGQFTSDSWLVGVGVIIRPQ